MNAYYCPACHSQDLELLFDMGNQPMSLVALQNDPDQSDCLERYKIHLAICKQCCHVHNMYFNPNYPNYTAGCRMYNSGHDWQAHVATVKSFAETQRVDTIIEIGAGDCEFLASLNSDAVKIAVDPSHASAKAAEELGIHHVREKFHASAHIPEGAREVEIIMRHLLEHMEQPRDFLETIAIKGHDRNCRIELLIEVPSCSMALNDCRIEDWTYEHPQHFTPTSMEAMLRNCCFSDIDVRTSYGGEVLIARATSWPHTQNYIQGVIKNFKRMESNIQGTRQWFYDNMDAIAFWGGAGKSAMFIRKFKLPEQAIVVDSHDQKWGMYVPGTRIEIRDPEWLRRDHGRKRTIIATTSWRAYDIAKEIVRDNIPCRALMKFEAGQLVEVPLGN